MSIMKKVSIALILLAICVAPAIGDDTSSEQDNRRQGPPPEAYEACEGKSAGETAQFTDARGETLTGTCEQEGDQLVLRPEGQEPGEREQGQHKPPLEAYEACEGKSAGETAQFTNSNGETISGTCEQDGDQLVLRPER
ncbi:MAG: hypothetical protein GY874_14185 [Desulfobacteraceae bacterium]|nr:hypothetical protein [Desulfobacteraceae bacterium]